MKTIIRKLVEAIRNGELTEKKARKRIEQYKENFIDYKKLQMELNRELRIIKSKK